MIMPSLRPCFETIANLTDVAAGFENRQNIFLCFEFVGRLPDHFDGILGIFDRVVFQRWKYAMGFAEEQSVGAL